MMTLAQVDRWIEKQTNSKDFTIRIKIPGYEKFRLEISQTGKKTIRMYYYKNGKVTYPLVGEIPYVNFEDCFRKGSLYIKEDKEPISAKTFNQVWEKFINDENIGLKPITISKYKVRYNKYIFPFLGYMNIEDISLVDIKTKIFTPNEKSPSTNIKLYYIIDNVLKFAKKRNWVSQNVLKDFKFSEEYDAPSRKNSGHYPKIVDTEDLKNFLINVSTNEKINLKRRILILFALSTALRSMNIYDLRWRDIDFEKKLIKIGKERMKGELKTLKSRQDFILPICDTMVSLLEKLKKLDKVTKPNAKVFEGISDQKINYFLTKIAGITKHGLRGTMKTFAMKRMMDHKIPNFFIELYMYHSPSISDVEASYIDARYEDGEIQAILRKLANWWDSYLRGLYDFRKVLLNEGEYDELSL